MVLELKVPHEPTWHAVAQLWPTFLSYLLSFFFIGDYWVNHHHMLHTLHRVDGKLVWLNLHLLFWISLIPFVTAWLGETYPAAVPTLVYGAVMLMAGFAFSLLQAAIAAQQRDPRLGAAHARMRRKGMASLALYAVGLPLAWYGMVRTALVLYLLVAVAYFVPERAFEPGAAE